MVSLLLGIICFSLQPQASGRVLSKDGIATILRDGKELRAAPGATLRVGDRLELGAGAELSARFTGGSVQRVRGPGQVVVDKKSFTPAEKVEFVKATPLSPMNQEKLDSRRIGGNILLGTGRLGCSPIHGATVLTDRPNFSWPVQPGVDGYIVQAWRDDGSDKTELWSMSVKEPKLSYPDKAPLEPGAHYFWKVFGVKDGKRGTALHSSEFARLPKAVEQNLKRDVKALLAAGTIESLQLAALLYEEYLALDDALALYEQLARRAAAEPAHQLALARYYRAAGKPAEAERARQRARELGARDEEHRN